MKTMTRARSLAVVLAVGGWAGGAFAQPSDKDADAERLFREGQKLLEERRYGDACPKFEAAYRKDHQLGTLLNLAYCHKEQGAIWTAWLEFREAEVKAGELKRTDRRDFAKQRMVELEKSLARVVVDPSSTVQLTEVLVEERRVPEAETGVVFAAEPGQRKLTFRARGKKEAVVLVTIVKERQPQHVAVPPMEDQEREPAPEPAPPPVVAAAPPAPPAPGAAEAAATGSGRKALALALAGVGVVGVGIGTVAGVMTLSNECTASAKRDDPAGCPDTRAGRDTATRGEASGMVANVAFGVGGGALVAAAILFFTAESKTKTTAPADARTSTGGGLRAHLEVGSGWAGLRGNF